MTDLGVYVSTLNEEVLIESTLRYVVEVFPQVEVIDLGSKDRTLARANQFGIPVNHHVMPKRITKHHPVHAGAEWTRLKNEYTAKHDWVFFIDGDEVFNKENLLKMKAKIEEGSYAAYRIGWKNLREHNGGVQESSILVNGPKLFKTSDYKYLRSYPAEVLASTVEGLLIPNTEPKGECDVWCWHGVLLNRTSSIPEASNRMKKRQHKAARYDKALDWHDIPKWPWK
jgi:glycosyltransferase involved in cell wall biosynthesis